MIADVVDYIKMRFVLGLAQASTKLLEPKNFRFSWAQEQYGVDGWKVHSLIENVNRKNDAKLTSVQLL